MDPAAASVDEVRGLVRDLVDAEGVVDADEAWERLRPLGMALAPCLAEAYPAARRWRSRVGLVHHSMSWGDRSPAAFALGLRALEDRSTLVRYRACGLLAWAQRREALPALQVALDHPGRADGFVDRDRSGRVTWSMQQRPVQSRRIEGDVFRDDVFPTSAPPESGLPAPSGLRPGPLARLLAGRRRRGA